MRWKVMEKYDMQESIALMSEYLRQSEIPVTPRVTKALKEGTQCLDRLNGNGTLDAIVQVASDLAHQGIPTDTALKTILVIHPQTGTNGNYEAAKLQLYDLVPRGGE